MTPLLYRSICEALESADLFALFSTAIGNPNRLILDETEYALLFNSETGKVYFLRDAVSDNTVADKLKEQYDYLSVLGYVSALELIDGRDVAQRIINDLRQYVDEKNQEG